MSIDHIVSRTVPGRTGRVWFTLLAFLCGTLAVYALTLDVARRTPEYAATSLIWSRGTGPGGTPHARVVPTPAAIEEELFSEPATDWTIAQPSPAEAANAAMASPSGSTEVDAPSDRRNVRVEVESNKARGEWLIAIRVADSDADRAVRKANHLAERYARRHRPAESEASRQMVLQSRANAEQARQQYAAAKQRLDDFLSAHFRRHQSDAERRVAAPSSSDSPAASAPSPEHNAPLPSESEASASAMIDNQLWLDLNRQRDELLQKRDRLLENRTALHPDVQELSVQVGDLDQRLAQIPRRVAVASSSPNNAQDETTADGSSAASVASGKRPVPPAAAATTTPMSAIAAKPSDAKSDAQGVADSAVAHAAERTQADREAAQTYGALHAEVERAEGIRDHMADQQRWAERRPTNVSSLEIQLADHAAPTSTRSRQPAMLAISLVAGAIVATGVGLFSAGFRRGAQPFSDPDQIETALSIPVVGVISSNQEGQGKRPARKHILPRSLARLGLFVLLAGAIGLLFVMMNSPGLSVPK